MEIGTAAAAAGVDATDATAKSLEAVASLIREGKAKRIICMVGAGISVSAGIPDFRTPGTGLYDNLQRFNLPKPEAVFDLYYFTCNPGPFFSLAKELFPGSFAPTPTHCFLQLLHSKGLLLRVYTQNIDSLEGQAGLPKDKVVAAHGNFDGAHCINCSKVYSQAFVKEHVYADKIPHCTHCGEVVKPDIVFFGEPLPAAFGKTSLQSPSPECCSTGSQWGKMSPPAR